METQTVATLDLTTLTVTELYDMRDEAQHRQHIDLLATLQAECERRYEASTRQLCRDGFYGPTRIHRGRRTSR